MTTSTQPARVITTYTGVIGFTAKGAVTGLSFVGGLVVAAANAAASTEIGMEIHRAEGLKGAVTLGVDLSFRAVESMTKDRVKPESVVSEEEADDLLDSSPKQAEDNK